MKIKKLIAIFLCAMIVFTSSNVPVSAVSYGTVSENMYCVVTKVFDGESFEAKNVNNNTYYLVKMIGVDAKAYDDSFQYTYNRLMGKQVLLTLDRLVPSPVGRWNYCYVRENNEVVNTKLIAMGYGTANVNTSNNTIYNQYANIETDAKTGNVGMWSVSDVDGGTYSGVEYSEDCININTASQSQIVEKLVDVNTTIAQNIISFRRYRPFNKVSDIKFVDGMTKEIYDKNVDKMHVSTNVNKAYEYELSTLLKIDTEQAQDIFDFVEKKNNRVTIDDLLDEDLISDDEYQSNKYFMTDTDEDTIIYALSNSMANVNTATESQLTSAGLASSDANGIIDIRDTGYTIKTLGELQYSDEVNLTDEGIRKLLDNIKPFTDINYSSKSELTSLFGKGYSGMAYDVNEIIDGRNYSSIDKLNTIIPTEQYQKIKNFIYVDKYNTNYVNINTATMEQLVYIGIDANTAKLVVNRHKESRLNDYSDLPSNINLKQFDKSITLFTNINNSSTIELTSLSTNMSTAFAQTILDYTKKQPFGSKSEVKTFFEQNNKGSLYDEIDEFIVLY